MLQLPLDSRLERIHTTNMTAKPTNGRTPAPPTEADIQNRAEHHPPTPEIGRQHEKGREHVHRVMDFCRRGLPPSREQAIAMTKLEEAMMWANAGIARNHSQITPQMLSEE